MRRITRRHGLWCLSSFVLVTSSLVACAGPEPSEPAATQAATTEPTSTSTAAPPLDQLAEAGTTTATDYDATETMFGIFSGPNHAFETTLSALERAREHGDRAQVPVIIEIMRFYGGAAVDGAYALTLEELTGVDFQAEPSPWGAAMEWHGQHLNEYQPPDGYRQWKADLLSLIDPRMGSFFTKDSTPALIDLTEVVWGGVRTDGIPDLRDPPTVEAAEASFMRPDDRVFGVSINGEHRAYPLRIVNAHEMANDWLGGQPIALAY